MLKTLCPRLPLPICLALAFALSWPAMAQVVINEIMYHPVEEPAFNPDGSPVLDLYEDVHEFVELFNPGTNLVALAGWKLEGGMRYDFPTNATIQAGEYLVVAKDPARLIAVPAYDLAGVTVLGPYAGQLGNRRDTVRLKNGAGRTVESVTYSAEFPWAISADALGADEEWTGIRALDYQYRGRSLERVSAVHPPNDPANWLASPLPGNPSPGRPNAVRRSVPAPVIIQFSVGQASDEAALIRNNQPARVQCVFSAAEGISSVRVEWFVDDIETTNEPKQVVAMSLDGPASAGSFTAVLPGQPDRSVVRFRFLADRGTGEEIVSPRADDPYSWHAYYVTPARTSTRPIYDCFISSSSLSTLGQNISQSPRRVVSPDPPGTPRTSWNATEPAVMVHEGIVYDIQMRHHGSRYNRSPGRNSFKWQFPRYRKFNGVTGIFETDKGNDFIVGHGLFRAIGLPVSPVRYVDLYLNERSVMQRLEQGEFDGDMLDEFHRSQQRLNPGAPLELSGEIYKNVGTIDMNGEGPYGRGDGRKLSKLPNWTDLQMYEWTFTLQNHGWRGSYYWKQMIDAFWQARGDTPSRPNPDIPALRTFFNNYFDVEEMLTFIALENWCCPWDDTTQNHFFWQRRDGRWGMLPWDNDGWFGRGDGTSASSSLFLGEVGDPNNNFRGPNFFKDAFIKAFRQELKERYFLLNNTFLHPDNLTALGFGSIRSFAQARQVSVNQQCGLGEFQRPSKPVNVAPAAGITALPPMVIHASPYGHSASPARPHAQTTWEIRAADGSYSAPVWKMSSTTNLTSIAIPFEKLRFGEQYFWRCTYEDLDGHRSVPSDETSFNFGPASSQTTVLAIDAATGWRYNQSGLDLSNTNWTALNYDDSAWPMGPGVLAKEEATLPEPIRTPLTLGQSTYYFRKRFSFPGQPQGAAVRMQYIVDDGCIIYVNGRELLRVRMPEGAVTAQTFATANVSDAVYEGPVEVPSSFFTAGDNVVAVEVHQSNSNSSDIVFGLSLEATLAAGAGTVALNEIAARNAGSVRQGSDTPDWIELYNTGSQTVNLAGYTLSDDVLVPDRFVFPPNSLIAARGYLTVWCDNNTKAPGLHAGFALNDQGQTVALFAPTATGLSVSDYVTFGLQAADYTLGRVADGIGAWQLNVPTPGAPNQIQALAPASNLKINEWMASPESGDDWFELFNPADRPLALSGLYLTDDLADPTITQVADLSFIGPHDFTRFVADGNIDKGAEHVGFKLSGGGEVIGVFDSNGAAPIDSITFGPQITGVSQGRLPDGAATLVSFPTTASPGDPNHLPLTSVVISEVLAHTDPPLEDAVELQNISASTVDISGWWLSDSRRNPRKFRIPAGTTLVPGQFAVFYEYQFNADTNSPTSFALSSAHGDELLLFQTDPAGALTGYRTKVDFGPTPRGVVVGRFPTSQGHDFTVLDHATFGVDNPANVEEFRRGTGQSNAWARVGPVAISEIMFRPPNIGTNDNRRDEFIELFNATTTPVPLFDPSFPANTWRLRGAVEFEFPPGVTLPPSGALVVVSFDPITNVTERAGFQAVYGMVAPLYGPFRGKLSNTADAVGLYRPDEPEDTPGPDFGFVPYVLAERVEYSSAAPWPAGADGTGASLTRINNAAYGNDPVNWKVATATPGQVASNAPWQLDITLVPGSPNLNIHATGPSATSLALQSSTDLVTWQDVTTASGGTGAFSYTVQGPSASQWQYFRLLIQH